MIEFFHLVERVSNTELWWNWHEINRFIGLFSMKFIDGRFPRRTLAFCKLCWSTDGNVPHEQDSRTVCSPDPGLKLRLGQWLLGWVFETQERKKTQCYACSRINFRTTFFFLFTMFPSSRTVSKRTPLEAPGTNCSRGVLLLTVLDEGT